jgi:hypothetical protein
MVGRQNLTRLQDGIGIFSGLAHWSKGGIFFWMGILSLGRWSGSFGELGWVSCAPSLMSGSCSGNSNKSSPKAWNARPKGSSRAWRPSAEFAESALIFTYGATNIFLEHLGGWGGEWTSQDLEHISITILFIGGGLVSGQCPSAATSQPRSRLTNAASVACSLNPPG